MNKKTIIIGFIVFFGIFGFMIWGQSAQKNLAAEKKTETNTKSSLIAVGETAFDFGTISMKNGKVSHPFSITNTSKTDILVKKVETSCMCTSAYLLGGAEKKGPFRMPGMGFVPPADEIIKPGESRQIEAVFDPNAHGPAGVGTVARSVFVEEESGARLEFNFKAEVTP
ncbi:MAG: DUF1573 domain-containing protein [Candidatus Paceibacterota bacterium]|jgi:hypothetical protein